MILKGYLFSVLYVLLCMALALIFYKSGLEKKYCRKIVHILVGFEWVILSHYMGTSYHFFIVCILFTLALLLIYLKNLVPMISSDSDNAPGTVYYAVAMSILSLVCIFIPDMLVPFGIGVFCTSFGDGFAGVVGQLFSKYTKKLYNQKSIVGMAANFVFSSLSAFAISKIYSYELSLWQCMAIGFLSFGLEAITTNGLDNITISLGVSLFAFALHNYETTVFYVIPIILTPIVILLVRQKRVLTNTGLAVALAMDLLISLTFGNFGFTLLLSFLVGGVITDKLKALKKVRDDIAKKEHSRDAIQVIANGLIPVMCAVIYSLTFNKIFLYAYIASVAEALADTSASGLGVYSKNTFDIFRFKKCIKGISGGMSFIGTFAALVGATLISTIAFMFGTVNLKLFFIVTAAAFLGSVFDSFLGSLFQVKYKCPVCGSLTEREEHCGSATVKVSGYSCIDNDIVNVLSSLFSAVICAVICIAVL